MAKHSECIKKLRELRDGVQDAIVILKESVVDSDRQIAIAMLETIYVSTDLAIDKPCGCGK